jgi:hypothetical protein
VIAELCEWWADDTFKLAPSSPARVHPADVIVERVAARKRERGRK